MTFQEWQTRWPQAAAELSQVFQPDDLTTGATSESATSKECEKLSGLYRQRLWRNNSGAATDERTGRLIRYGLGNTSARLNAVMKSSDYIGITSVIIQPRHVGRKIGVFTALEMKRPGWHLTPGDERGQAQCNYLTIVENAGGIGKFITNPKQYVDLIGEWCNIS